MKKIFQPKVGFKELKHMMMKYDIEELSKERISNKN